MTGAELLDREAPVHGRTSVQPALRSRELGLELRRVGSERMKCSSAIGENRLKRTLAVV